ncbi:DUF4038 domain-containing protein [Seonamhaeicola sp.]|uniref:apiosidase-like domain-containing protein n=1 Tax=Seonamhaeicola sp. TaxID=1912245 RepID=UPI0026344CDB|nr:DUF4038 domain-containing protein [Seonamhaeicola sp.]
MTRFLVWALLLGPLGFAQIKVWKAPGTITSQQWQVNDLVYIAKQKVEKPFQQEVYAMVRSEEGEQKVPLFYNGGNEWVFRYSSSNTGKKSFVIQSDIKGLKGKKGAINITQNQKKDRHGGIVLSDDNKRHFFYEDGTHYFNLAFECDWLYALDYGNKDLPKTKHLLGLLNKNGFNQIVMNVYAYGLDFDWVRDKNLLKHPEHNYGEREDIFPFLGSNSNPDYSALNMGFFKHFDQVVAQMHEHEIISHLMIYVWNKRVAWPEARSEADNMYYDHVIKRYQAFPNIVWDVSKEATNKIAVAQNKNVVEHILERTKRTRELDSYDRLLSVHAYSFCRKYKDEVDFISTQDWKLSLHESMLSAYKQFPDKPIFNIEHGGYEESPYEIFPGGYSNAEACLRRNYLCLFAGTYTTYYWQGTSWNAIIHNPFEQPDDVYKPKFEYFKYMRDLFKTVNFENFEPVTKYNVRSYNLTNYKEGVVMQYIPKEVHSDDIKRQLDAEFDYSNATRQWFNTLTGEFSKEEKLVFKHKYGFWDERPWRHEADVIFIIKNLKPKQ